jgi:hypothetical protein
MKPIPAKIYGIPGNEQVIIKISECPPEFQEWIKGQTCPLVEDDDSPFDWAYESDYERWLEGLPNID